MKIQESWFGKIAFSFEICDGWKKDVWTNSLSLI